MAYLLAVERAATDDQVVELLREVGVRRWRLVGVGGPVEGQVLWLLREATYRLGADDAADLRLPDDVEGHAMLEVRQRGAQRTCEVTGGDGVRVEGQALDGARPLADGDLLEVGGARFVVETPPDTPDQRVPAARRAWLTVVTPADRARERLAFTDALPLARLTPDDDRRVEWEAQGRRWVVRRPDRADAPIACGDLLALGPQAARVEARFVALPDAVARADVREHVERVLARRGPDVEVGRALITAGPDAGRAIVLRRGENRLADGLVLGADLDADATGWHVVATSVPTGSAWTLPSMSVVRAPDELHAGRPVARSRGGRRELRGALVSYELAIGDPLAPIVDGYLVASDGPDAGLRFPLRLGSTRIGADGDADVVLADRTARGADVVVTVHRGWRPVHDPPAWGPRFTWRAATEREERPLEDGDAIEIGATRLVLRASTLGGPPRAWLTRLDGARPGEAFAVTELGLSLLELPWAAWDLAQEKQRVAGVQVQRDGAGFRLTRTAGRGVSVEGHPGREALEDGDVLRIGDTVRLRFDLAPATRGASSRGEGVRLRPEPEPFTPAAAAPVAPPPPAHRVVRDQDLQTWSPALALSPAGELAVVKKDEVSLHAPGGEPVWTRPGGRATEPWQPRPGAVAFDRDGRLLVAFTDGVLEVLDRADGRTLEQLRPAKEAMVYLSAALVASPTEPLALVVGPHDASSFEGTRDLRVVAWDLAARQVRWIHELTVGRKYPRPLLPRSRGVFFWHVDRCRPGGFEFVDSMTWRGSTVDGTTETLPAPDGRPISALADLDDEHLLVVAGGRLGRWQRSAPHAVEWFAGDGGESRRGPLAVSPDRRFAACAGEELLELWHLGARRRLHVAPLAGDRVLALELGDDGRAYVITFPSRLRVVAFDLTAALPPAPSERVSPVAQPGQPAPPRPATPRRAEDPWAETLRRAGAWVKGLFFEER